MTQDFVHLNVHSEYSLLASSIRVPAVIERAKELEMDTLAITDWGNMFGAIEFYTKAKKAGIKPILGAEIYLTSGHRFERPEAENVAHYQSQDEQEARFGIHHLTLLCKDNLGYQNLCEIISQAYLEGTHYRPRADYELLNKYSKGLLAISGGLKGEAAYYLHHGQEEKARDSVKKMKEIFKEDFYIELQDHGLSEQKILNKKLVSFSKDLEIPLVATNDCFYLHREDSSAQDVLLCAGTKRALTDETRIKLGNDEYYFKTQAEMHERFSDYPEALSNTRIIADKCNVELTWTDEEGNQIYHLPDFEIDTGETQDEYFRRTTAEGLEDRFKGPHFNKLVQDENWESTTKPIYMARMVEELEMIIGMGFSGYFLIVADFIGWAKERDIPVGPGRGSGAGSIVAYALNITNINPLPYNLLFERFINPERISMPDFDVDFCQQRRGEVIDYVTEKYGKERVGQIVTFGKLQAKAAIRDVSRVLSLPYSEADMLSKLVPDELGITLDKALEMEPKFTDLMDSDPKIRQIMQISRKVEGLNRHASIHAAGVIITSDPLVKYCPLLLGAKGEQVIQYDKNYSEEIGLVKFDFLGLKTLTVISYASEFIKKNHDAHFDIENVDMEDSEVYEFISRGETIGVFQLESSGMIDLCKRIKPDCIDDITAINALYRPGPMESGMVDDFVDIKNGKKEISYPFQELETVLKDTLGVIVYQEQVMNIARIIAGYSLGQADMLRRAMGKKKVSEMDRHKEIFKTGALEKKFDEKKAVELFESMAKFAAYGFNKSHAVAYAFIAYQTAYLKYYYPASFFAGLLSTELNNTDKITIYINDTRNYNIEVLPPDVNESTWLFNVVGENIRFAMGAIKNVGEPAANEIVREREENGPFVGFIDLCERVDLRIVNKRAIDSLIKVGAFDKCENFNRKTLLESMEFVMTHGNKISLEKELGQVNLFDMPEMGVINSDKTKNDLLNIKEIGDFEEREKLDYEFQLLGIYVSGHPLDRYAEDIERLASMSLSKVQDLRPKAASNQTTDPKRPWARDQGSRREVTLAGMVTSSRNILTKKGDKMSFLNLEDLSGKIECIVFPKVFSEFEEILGEDEPLLMDGYVNTNEDPKKFFPERIKKLMEQREERVTGVRISVKMSSVDGKILSKFKRTLLSYRGTVPMHVIFEDNHGRARLPLGEDFLINPSPQFAAQVNDLFNDNCVKFIIDGKVSETT